MSTAISIATRRAPGAALTKTDIVPTNEVDFNRKTYRKFARSIVDSARAIQSPIGEGSNGRIYLLESVAAYTTRTGRTDYTKAAHPGAIDFTGATANAQIARIKETRTTDLETYHTQECVRAGLRKIIVANVPAKILVGHKNAESGLDEVEPCDLLETIRRRAAPVTCLDAKALKAARGTPLTFDTTSTLTTQFALSKKAIADLQRIHSVTTSKSEMMMESFLETEKEKDFEDQVVKFRARTTNNGFGGFITFFGECDVEVCCLNKIVQGRVKAARYHSAANDEANNKYIDDKVNAKMADLVAVVEAAMDDCALDSGATASIVGSNKTAANVADKLISSTQDVILATLKTISVRLDNVEKGDRGCRHHGRWRGGADKDANTQAAREEHKPCVNCGKRHKLLNKKCWALGANKDNRPAN